MTKLSKLLLAVALPISAPSILLAQALPDRAYAGHMWGDNRWSSVMGHGGMFLFWILIIVLIVLAVRWALDRDRKNNTGNSALDILKEGLARGEITPAEYEERRKILSKH